MLSPSEHFQVASADILIECQSPSTSNEEESTLLSPNSATSTPSQDTSDRNTPDLSNRAIVLVVQVHLVILFWQLV